MDVQPSSAELDISDDSTTIPFPVGDLLQVRTATLVGASDWTFAIGSEVTLQWSSSSDVMNLRRATVDFELPTTPAQGFVTSSVAYGSGTLAFVIPSTPSGQGAMGITLEGTIAGVDVQQSVSQNPVTITP